MIATKKLIKPNNNNIKKLQVMRTDIYFLLINGKQNNEFF